MTRSPIAPAAGLLVCLLALTAPAGGEVEVGRHVVVIQGFEALDVLTDKPNISYLSGVPEAAEVEVWDTPDYKRRRIPVAESGVSFRASSRHKTQGKASLAATFTRGDRVVRVSLRNNINQSDRAPRPACNSIGCFDCLRGDVFNPADAPVKVEMRVLGGFAVTDKAGTFALVKGLTLKPGWNTFTLTSHEASATFVDPHDATCVEFRVPAAKAETTLHFDNFRMERETIGTNLSRHARCFDFGVSHFNWPGFTYGSVKYDEKRGYGFTSGTRLTHGGDLHVINDQLTRDGFKAPASFRVKLPNGRYRVVTQTGNYWAQRDGGRNIEIKAEGKRVHYRPAMTGQEFTKFRLAHENADHWRRGIDLWGTYDEGTYFRTVSFEAEVADGALDLDFLLPPVEGGRGHGSSVWTYLIVYPADKDKLIAPELKWLNEKVRTIYNKVSHVPISRQFALYGREEVICPEEFLWPDIAEARRAALKPTAAEKARGYVHFLRHQHDLMIPDSVPLPGEVGDRLAVFGTPGETVSWAVGLYPLRDLEKVTVRLGGFEDAAGKPVVPAKSADVRLVSYRPITPVTSNHAECFHYIGPGVLIPPAPTDVPKAFPRRWWMSLPVPKDLPAGVYRATVRFEVSGKPASAVEVALRVLPFELAEPEGVTFAIDYRRTMSFRPSDGPRELAFFRGLGMNTVWYRGRRDDLAAMRRAAAKAGMKVELGLPDKHANWRWPRDYRHGLVRRYLARGQSVSFQPRHTGHREGRKIRFTHGFWLWRSGIRHRVVQTQPNAAERVYYAHYGHAKFGPCSYLFPSLRGPGEFNPAPTLYEVRDGITDWRYIQRLEQILTRAGQLRNDQLKHAAACLAELKESVDPSLDRYYFERKRHFNHVGRFGLHDTVWTGRRYQTARWQLAWHIAAAKGKPVEPAAAPARATAPVRPILHAEYFGPWWVFPEQFKYIGQEKEGTPTLQPEVPATPVGANWATVLVKLNHPSKAGWVAVLTDSAAKELCRQDVGRLRRWKSRWVLRTDHLPAGSYTLRIVPADADVKLTREIKTTIKVVPGII